jgi:citrate synthase
MLTKINIGGVGVPVSGWIGADEAARRLGVKPATLYAYVSRGVLARRKADDGRSVFDPAEVDRLARRGRPRRQRGASELVIESAVTLLGEDRHYYRGRDAIELAGVWQLEQVAGWLWTGAEPADAEPDWAAGGEAVAVARAAQRGLPAGVLPLERLQVIATALAVADPVRLTLEPPAVTLIGQTLVAGMIEALPAREAPREASWRDAARGPVAGRLWARLAAPGADERLADALRFAMVLLADHELAASTLAARVAASVRADPYAVVAAGLGVTSGALHGGASLGVESMLAESMPAESMPAESGPGEPASAQATFVMGRRLRQGERIPGFGHAVYRSGDARASALLERIRRAVPDHPRLAVADAMLDEARRRRLPAVNVDFPLGLLANLAGMPRGAGEAIFAIARTVGWLAHAMEEYAHPTRLRLRASYTGPLS